MIYYKAVRVEGTQRLSLVIGRSGMGDVKAFEIEYIPNEWTFPKFDSAGIYVFGDLKQAIHRAGIETESFEIWECKTKNPRPFKHISYSFYERAFNNFWKEYKKLRQKRHSLDALYGGRTPDHTYLASAIKLHKLVAVKEFGLSVRFLEESLLTDQ